ncbi:hypothetical protein KI387_038833, partial [Taxus chinensis]
MLSNNRIHLMVSHPGVKDFVLNKDMNEKHVGWITKVMEYDVHIKVTKLVRGKGLCQQLAADLESKGDEDMMLLNNDERDDQVDWLSKMKAFLLSGTYPVDMDRTQRQNFHLQSIPYVLVDNVLFRRDLNGVLLWCIGPEQ